MQRIYDFFVYENGQWVCAMTRRMSRQAACGLFNGFKSQYSVQLFSGNSTAGKLIGAHYRPEHLVELAKTNFPQNLKEMNPND